MGTYAALEMRRSLAFFGQLILAEQMVTCAPVQVLYSNWVMVTFSMAHKGGLLLVQLDLVAFTSQCGGGEIVQKSQGSSCGRP
eukprot:3076165-Rhodomonas_salina.2